jgi:uncharacterized protein
MSNDLRQANVDVVRQYLEGINRWDFDAMRELMAEDDFVFEQAFVPEGMQSRYEGRDSLLDFQRSLVDTIITEGLYDFTLEPLHSDPGEILATYKSDMQMADPSFKYSNDYICRFSVRDGRITRFVEYFDSVRLVRGFGGTVRTPKIG